MKALLIVLALLCALPCAAEQTPAWPTAQQPLAAAISNVALGAQVGIDTYHSFKAEDRKAAFCEQGLGVGLAVGIHTALTSLVHRERPDGSDDRSFPSGHVGAAAASGGWNYSISVSLSSLVAMGRVGANVHHISDVAAGFAIGTGSRLLAQKVCR
jgi:membrane-associated phospholipid phosphatase